MAKKQTPEVPDKDSGNKTQPKKETFKEQRAREGFYDCEMWTLEDGEFGNTAGFGKKIKEIKQMHKSNVDEYNTQQLNSKRFIKIVGFEYELVSQFAKGRLHPETGEPHPYKVFREKNK